MQTVVVHIRNMHCKSCELLLESALSEIDGVHSVRVSYKKQRATIQADETMDLAEIHEAIEDAGYSVGDHDAVGWFTGDSSEYALLIISFFIALSLMVLFRGVGLDRIFSTAASPSSGLLSVLLVGLTAGVSTCMALVGGLVLAVSARHAEKHPGATTLQKFRPHIFFNLGRVAGFFVLGGLLGLLGAFLQPTPLWMGIITIFVGLIMLLLGVQLLEISPRISRIHFTLPASVGRACGVKTHAAREYSHGGALLAGVLTFFLPCGFTQAMQVASVASGSFLTGGLIMAMFAFGTVPGLLGVGGLSSVVRGTPAKLFFKITGIIVIALAVFNMTNGYHLTGWPALWSSSGVVVGEQRGPTIENGAQVVRMRQTGSGYSPKVFTIRRGVPVRWIIDATNMNSCSASIVVPSLGIRKTLTLGENIVEFTPQEAGTVRFSCSMGMYSGQFIVIE
jgi:sulfite exporter TauE/SafE/copper chaperone CopZ